MSLYAFLRLVLLFCRLLLFYSGLERVVVGKRVQTNLSERDMINVYIDINIFSEDNENILYVENST